MTVEIRSGQAVVLRSEGLKRRAVDVPDLGGRGAVASVWAKSRSVPAFRGFHSVSLYVGFLHVVRLLRNVECPNTQFIRRRYSIFSISMDVKTVLFMLRTERTANICGQVKSFLIATFDY